MIVYLTTNLINGKKYIGADTKNNPSYIGSGKALLSAIKKYGKENFKKEILEHCKDHIHLREREIYWVQHFNADSSTEYYNIAHGGQGAVKGRPAWNSGLKIDKDSEEYKKMYINRKKANKSYITDEWKETHSEKIKVSTKFQQNKNKKIDTRKLNGNPWHTDQTKKKISEAVKGRIKTEEEKLKRKNTIQVTGCLAGKNNPMSKTVKVTNLLTKETIIFNTIKEAEKNLGISRFHMKNGKYKDFKFEIINGLNNRRI